MIWYYTIKARGRHNRIAFYVPNQKQTFLMLNSKHSATGAASRKTNQNVMKQKQNH